MLHFKEYVKSHLGIDFAEIECSNLKKRYTIEEQMRSEEMQRRIQKLSQDNNNGLEESMQILFKYKAITSQNTQYLEFDYIDLLDLMINDFYSFHLI